MSVIFLTEDGLYEVLMQSRKPIAKQFKKGVKKILREVRRTGQYNSLTVPQTFSEALMLAAKQQEEIERQEKEILCLSHKVAEMKPKADYCDLILRSPDPIVVTQIAKDYGMSPQEFNKKLHILGVQYKVNGQWLLYAKYQGAGYTVSHTGLKKNSAGTWISTFWTQKGRLFLYGKLKEAGVLPVIEQTKGHTKPMVNNIDDLFV